ncbi:uncharacterized protein LOC119334028 [Triticum dicoccoides]|uniref:uncharacterized protein LOC119334028 n=1 Tax=Triticum dicoccoides TaxID=85692 RepID=UPI001890DB2A|nr:uncharacterized protein LOC119334028 [Triticum dicoccoides]
MLSSVQKLTPRPYHMFIHLRHMTSQLTVMSLNLPNSDNDVLQLARCLDVAPQLEMLHLDVSYSRNMVWVHDDLVEEEGLHMRRHDHLKTVNISGFRCYTAQTKLACCILENACVLEHMRIPPWVSTRIWCYFILSNMGVRGRFLPEVHEWAQITSERFGKTITVLDDPSE